MKRFSPIHPKFPHFIHGGDYNPDQWQATPEIWDEDMRLMKLAKFNAPSIGIFAWAQLEVAEGQYDFDWFDRILEKLVANDIYAIIATPSAAPPPWLCNKYPEVLRVNAEGVRSSHIGRVNYCLTSPVLREKLRTIDAKIAERVKDHPAPLMWHINNEMARHCYCDLCQAAFREWLKAKYDTLDALNQAWWSAFWSHTYSDWEEIVAPPAGRGVLPGLNLDWERFSSDQQLAFYQNEADVLRAITPNIPVTTNTWRGFGLMDFRDFGPAMDVAASDCYPHYQDQPGDEKIAPIFSFTYDIYRALKGGQPFVLMETTPSSAFMFPSCKLKRPNAHRMACLQAVAHGADSVCYFQWRMGRGGAEQYHGAVVAHDGTEHTRVFREVAAMGDLLSKLDDVVGTSVQPEVALIHDQEVNWALSAITGHYHGHLNYPATCVDHYRPFWARGIPVDVIHMNVDFSNYKLLVAPMLYLLRPGVAERIAAFVENGGTFVTTYYSGMVEENMLTFLGGFPGPLRELLGIWVEETDALDDGETRLGAWLGDTPLPERKLGRNRVVPATDNPLGLKDDYEARHLCDLLHLEGAESLAAYGDEFYAGRSAVTVNTWGKGQAYYIASRNDERFHDDFYGALAAQLGLASALGVPLPPGVTAQVRGDEARTFVFLLNFTAETQTVTLGEGTQLVNVETGETHQGSVTLVGYRAEVYERCNS